MVGMRGLEPPRT